MISIDPGTRFLGWARWEGYTLIGAGCSKAEKGPVESLARAHVHAIGARSTALCVVESMEHASGRATTPQDLIDVQAVGCLVAASVAPVWALLGPSEWKTNLDKAMHHLRILAVLTPGEQAIAQAAARSAGSHGKEVLDAVGIGMYYLRRTNKSGGPRV